MSDADSDPDEATLWAGRLRPWPTVDTPDPTDGIGDDADETRVVRRSAPPDDTVASPRAASPAPVPDDTVASRRAATPDIPDEGTLVARRGSTQTPPPTPVEATEVRPATRREASGRIAAPADTPRNARVPGEQSRKIYRPRAPEPAVVPRAAVVSPPSARPAPDHHAAARRARSRRTRALVILCAAGLIAVAAAVTLVILSML